MVTTETNSLLPPAGLGRLENQVIGVGGPGTSAVDALKLDALGSVQLAAVNTDAQALELPACGEAGDWANADPCLGAGGELDIGRAAAEADRPAGCADCRHGPYHPGGWPRWRNRWCCRRSSRSSRARLMRWCWPSPRCRSVSRCRRQRIAEDGLGGLRKQVHGLIPLPTICCCRRARRSNAQCLCRGGSMDRPRSECPVRHAAQNRLGQQDFSSLRSVFQNRGGKTRLLPVSRRRGFCPARAG